MNTKSSSTPPGERATMASPPTASWAFRYRAFGSPTKSLGRRGLGLRSELPRRPAWRCRNRALGLPVAQTYRSAATPWFTSTNRCRRFERTGKRGKGADRDNFLRPPSRHRSGPVSWQRWERCKEVSAGAEYAGFFTSSEVHGDHSLGGVQAVAPTQTSPVPQ